MLEKLISNATASGEPLPHVLLLGGEPQTRMAVATFLAHQCRADFRIASDISRKTSAGMASQFIGLKHGILFLDALEKLTAEVEDVLRSALINGNVLIKIEEWGVVRQQEIELSPFTLVATTSHERIISPDLLQLFQIQLHVGV